MLEKPACEGGRGGVQTEQLFQRFLFCESASCRRGWHWNGIWEQCDRDRGRSPTSESGSRSFKNVDSQLADREKQLSISCRVFQCAEPSAVCEPRHKLH